MNAGLTQDEIQLIRREEELAAQSIAEIQQSSSDGGPNLSKVHQLVQELRDEATNAKESDLPALLDQIASAKALIERAEGQGLPNPAAPYFAHMVIEEGGIKKDILIGQRTFLAGTLPIIDWKSAPIAKVFFKYRVGDTFEERLPGRLAMGVVLQRNIVTFQDGALVGIMAGERSYQKALDSWQNNPRGARPRLSGGEGAATRMARLGTRETEGLKLEIAALLDREQYAVLDQSLNESILILGAAGSGKTTVGIYRLASQLSQNPAHVSEDSAAVMVPEEGLRRLSAKFLQNLGLGRVQVLNFAKWIERLALMNFSKVPLKLCAEPPYAALKFKRHPSMRGVIEKVLDERKDKLADLIRSKFSGAEEVLSHLTKHRSKPYGLMLDVLKNYHLGLTKNKSRQKVIRNFYERLKTELRDFQAVKGDLLMHRAHLEFVGERSNGFIGARDIDDVLVHTALQLGLGQEDEEDFEGIDDDRLEMLDGTSLIKELKDDPLLGSADSEDFSLLFTWLELAFGEGSIRIGKPWRYLFIDETQDFCPLELGVLKQGLLSDASQSIAGDFVQIVDETSYFTDWSSHAAHLGVRGIKEHTLLNTYRSTEPINEFAHGLLGGIGNHRTPMSKKTGSPVICTTYQNEGQALLILAESLIDLMLEEPKATVAVIAKDWRKAQFVFSALKDTPKIRLVEGGDFSFFPGIDVTSVDQVKGLEFDYVIIPDGSPQSYPNSIDSRRKMHVAATRAIHQLWVIGAPQLSPIVKNLQVKEYRPQAANSAV